MILNKILLILLIVLNILVIFLVKNKDITLYNIDDKVNTYAFDQKKVDFVRKHGLYVKNEGYTKSTYKNKNKIKSSRNIIINRAFNKKNIDFCYKNKDYKDISKCIDTFFSRQIKGLEKISKIKKIDTKRLSVIKNNLCLYKENYNEYVECFFPRSNFLTLKSCYTMYIDNDRERKSCYNNILNELYVEKQEVLYFNNEINKQKLYFSIDKGKVKLKRLTKKDIESNKNLLKIDNGYIFIVENFDKLKEKYPFIKKDELILKEIFNKNNFLIK